MPCPYYDENLCYSEMVENEVKPSEIPKNLKDLCKTHNEWLNCIRFKRSELGKEPEDL
jgi:hypothetical protein